mmetsp:Transcript_18057/g.51358  ORF Transcript_18057/g.51358 Transcript_18057/m.51358 type:complete len:235 (+) Transcript_18057:780-1484(+)
MPSSSCSPPPHFGYMTSTVPWSSSTKEMIARLERSGRAMRTAVPQENAPSSLGFSDAVPPTPRSIGTGAPASPGGGRSSEPMSRSPALNLWMSSWVRSAAEPRRTSSGSEPSKAATSSRNSANGFLSESSSDRLPSSRMKLCLKFSSNVGGPPPSETSRAQDSGPNSLPKVTAATFDPSAACTLRRTGANSDLMSSSVLWSSKRVASIAMQLSSSFPLYSFRNCTAYSSTGSTM